MNVLTTQFSLETRSLDIYLAGCKGPHCENCHNPESWDFNKGSRYAPEKFYHTIREKVENFPDLISRFMVLGGEPMDHPENLLYSLTWMLSRFDRPVWLFTGKQLSQVPVSVRRHCDYLKCGRYEENLRGEKEQYGVKLASTNQHIFKKGVDF